MSKQKTIKTRKLSWWRVAVLLSVIAIGTTTALYGWREWRVDPASVSGKPWFAPYVDATAMPQYSFEQASSDAYKDVMLSFIVANPDSECQPSWGGVYTIQEASDALDIDRRIARLEQQGGAVGVSFGGLNNQELAVACSDESKLADAYKSVVEHYNLSTIDLDLENIGLTDQTASVRRANVIGQLQKERRKAGKNLAVWVTIPVGSEGLTEDATTAIATLLAHSVDLAGINIMTMNYNDPNNKGKSMSDIAINAIKKTHRQIGILYEQAGTYLNDATVWRKIGVTPMIGQTDITNEVFTLDDAARVNKFARSNGVARMSMWSLNRDVECGTNYMNTSIVSDSCSGTKQDKLAYSITLGGGFVGRLNENAGNVTKSQEKPSADSLKDDPATSPYQVWSEAGVYLQGTKVVWHHNVYQAKWWTKGESPDNPVLQSYQTPWELIGPVLPGEKPAEKQTLPAGTYPEWSGEAAYEAKQRVLFEGVPYQAKWWNRGDSPAAASSNPDGSPWVPLTQAEVKQVLKAL